MQKASGIINEKSRRIAAVLLLAVIVLALYWPVIGYDFIAMDDNLYLLDNPDIRMGISRHGISWAMTTLYTANWHPLTWLSLLADYDLYGLNAAGYHITSLLLHLLNTLLLFLVLLRMTGETWKCLTVAALFAVHPLNLESVAWIAERKNVLSMLFWLLTLFAYIRYVERPGWRRYLAALFFFALGLMAKPALVTLPFILMLLDYWPLQRFSPLERWAEGRFSNPVKGASNLLGLFIEKFPFFLLSLCSVLITIYAAKAGGAVKSITEFPFSGRIGNAFIACASYLDKMIWPVDLAIFYPYPAMGQPAWFISAALLFLVSVTVFVVLKGGKHPYLITGWFWYLINLLPVIGIIQVGYQSMANRYAYIPLVGIFLIAAWGMPEFLKENTSRRYIPFVASVLVLIFSFSTWAQLPHWRNSEAVFKHALMVTEDNFLAHCGMGDLWQNRGVFQIARLHYQEALRIRPGYAEVYNNLGAMLIKEGRIAEGEAGIRAALKRKPDLAEAHNNLGAVMSYRGHVQEAAIHFTRALELKPGYPTAKQNLEDLIRGGKLGRGK